MRSLSLVSRLIEVPDSRLRRVDARVKVAVALLLVLTLAFVPQGRFLPFGRFGLLLALLVFAGGVPIGSLLVRLLPLVPFLLAALFIPFLHVGVPVLDLPWLPPVTLEGCLHASSVVVRMLSIGGIMALLAATTPLDELLVALHAFRVPAGVVYALGFTFRYLFLLFDEGQRMHRAYASRGGAMRPAVLARQSLGAIVGVLFLRAYERGERVHRAMCARGFDTFARPASGPSPAPAHIAGGVAVAIAGFVLSLLGAPVG